MEVVITRRWKRPATTMGVLAAGTFGCFSLEDEVRERDVDGDGTITATDVADFKIPGKTAIPSGRFELRLTPSGRARRGTLWSPWADHRLPELVSVPGYTAARIHALNTAAETEGCIGIGLDLLVEDCRIGRARDALTAFMDLLHVAELRGEAAWVTIINQFEEAA